MLYTACYMQHATCCMLQDACYMHCTLHSFHFILLFTHSKLENCTLFYWNLSTIIASTFWKVTRTFIALTRAHVHGLTWNFFCHTIMVNKLKFKIWERSDQRLWRNWLSKLVNFHKNHRKYIDFEGSGPAQRILELRGGTTPISIILVFMVFLWLLWQEFHKISVAQDILIFFNKLQHITD